MFGSLFLVMVTSGALLQAPEGLPAEPAACGRCHDAIHREWQQSAHALAFTDAAYQQALRTRRQPERCLPCHVPDSVLERLGNMPRARVEGRDQGITCAACHVRDGVVHGPYGVATAAHPSQQDPSFGDRGGTALCAGCHATQIADVLPLARDFAGSKLPQQGKSCVGCHMPELQRALAIDPDSGAPAGPKRFTRSHLLLGPDDPVFCREAFGFDLRRRGEQLLLVIHNEAGHRVPGTARRRSFTMTFRQRDGNGRQLHERQFVVSSSNPLLVDEDRQLVLPAMPGVVAVDVAVDHGLAGKNITRLLERQLALK